ncbi:hypothetical protein PENTCL1PPCAC_21604, partial [Pristionchus entomophagus]
MDERGLLFQNCRCLCAPRRVQLAWYKTCDSKVQLLEANSCCDRLVLEDAVLGGNIVTNLTGELSDGFYTTKSSNF